MGNYQPPSHENMVAALERYARRQDGRTVPDHLVTKISDENEKFAAEVFAEGRLGASQS